MAGVRSHVGLISQLSSLKMQEWPASILLRQRLSVQTALTAQDPSERARVHNVATMRRVLLLAVLGERGALKFARLALSRPLLKAATKGGALAGSGGRGWYLQHVAPLRAHAAWLRAQPAPDHFALAQRVRLSVRAALVRRSTDLPRWHACLLSACRTVPGDVGRGGKETADQVSVSSRAHGGRMSVPQCKGRGLLPRAWPLA